MSSGTVGVQGRILQISPLVAYIHCNGHCQNLVIATACSLIPIINMLSKVKYSCNFFSNSLKHEGLLSAVVTKGVIETSRRNPYLIFIVQDGQNDMMHIGTFIKPICL